MINPASRVLSYYTSFFPCHISYCRNNKKLFFSTRFWICWLNVLSHSDLKSSKWDERRGLTNFFLSLACLVLFKSEFLWLFLTFERKQQKTKRRKASCYFLFSFWQLIHVCFSLRKEVQLASKSTVSYLSAKQKHALGMRIHSDLSHPGMMYKNTACAQCTTFSNGFTITQLLRKRECAVSSSPACPQLDSGCSLCWWAS